jgi:predicted metal-binding membrane protein
MRRRVSTPAIQANVPAVGAPGWWLEVPQRRARTGSRVLGCCWVLMSLLFGGGVMNLAVIAALMVIVFIEKIAPFGMRSTLVSGGLLIGLGLWVITC